MMNEKLIFGVILSLEIVCSSCRPWRVPRGRFRLCRSTARCSAVRLVCAFLAAGCIDVPSLAAVVTSGVLVGTILLTMVRASAAIAWLAAVAVGLISTLELCTLCTQLMGWDWSSLCNSLASRAAVSVACAMWMAFFRSKLASASNFRMVAGLFSPQTSRSLRCSLRFDRIRSDEPNDVAPPRSH